MKKTIAILVFLMVAFSAFADGLNEVAAEVKSKSPAVYEAIKERAVLEWGNDHQMVLYTINNQCVSFAEFIIMISQKGEDQVVMAVMVEAVGEWADDGTAIWDKYPDNWVTAPVDWQMVMYTVKNQIEAAGSY